MSQSVHVPRVDKVIIFFENDITCSISSKEYAKKIKKRPLKEEMIRMQRETVATFGRRKQSQVYQSKFSIRMIMNDSEFHQPQASTNQFNHHEHVLFPVLKALHCYNNWPIDDFSPHDLSSGYKPSNQVFVSISGVI